MNSLKSKVTSGISIIIFGGLFFSALGVLYQSYCNPLLLHDYPVTNIAALFSVVMIIGYLSQKIIDRFS